MRSNILPMNLTLEKSQYGICKGRRLTSKPACVSANVASRNAQIMNPADTRRLYNIESTSTQRQDVASTLMRRCINVTFPLDRFLLFGFPIRVLFLALYSYIDKSQASFNFSKLSLFEYLCLSRILSDKAYAAIYCSTELKMK